MSDAGVVAADAVPTGRAAGTGDNSKSKSAPIIDGVTVLIGERQFAGSSSVASSVGAMS